MANQILPGTYIEVRAEGLIRPGPVTVGNVGVIGTAAKGPVGVPVILSSFAEAKQKFYTFDPFQNSSEDLTLVRALQIAFNFGASTVFAVRVAGPANKPSRITLKSTGGDCVQLEANSPGEWGNDLTILIEDADGNAFVSNEKHTGAAPKLNHPPITSSRNRVTLFIDASNTTRNLKIITSAGAPAAGEVRLNADQSMDFGPDVVPAANDKVTVSYVVAKANAVKVTVQLDQAKEIYTVVDGNDLAQQITNPDAPSAWLKADAKAQAGELPSKTVPADVPAGFTEKGSSDQANADYQVGLDVLLNQNAHIIVAAGQTDTDFGAELDQHCQKAATDEFKHDRIGVIGSKLNAKVEELQGHTLDSDRIIFVTPGITIKDVPSKNDGAIKDVTLPATYTAAAIAGMLSGVQPHISLTNKSLPVNDLEKIYTSAELEQLVQARILAVEKRLTGGVRIVKGITTSDGPFKQITTRRIVDYAKFGVRAAADPFIGLLNNERVRTALKTSINSFLAQMVKDEMLITYDLGVSATRDEQIQGIASVTMTLQPVFSIDFIKVTMFLE